MITDRTRHAPGMKAQLAALRAALARGVPRRGWKVGINVPEVLRQLGLRHSGVGWLNGDREHRSGDVVACPPGGMLHAEPELCLRLSAGVSAGASPDEARATIAAVAPAIELVDYARARADLDTIVGHSMFHHGFVVGEWRAVDGVPEIGATLPTIEVAGGVSLEPRRDLVPQDLGEIVTFVAAFLAEFGESSQRDDLIFSGSFTATALALPRGAEVRADFGTLGEVRFQVRLSPQACSRVARSTRTVTA